VWLAKGFIAGIKQALGFRAIFRPEADLPVSES